MQWVASGLNRGEPIEKARAFELKGNDLRIMIHRGFYVERWLLTCKTLDIDQQELGDTSFDEAVEKSKKIIQKRIEFLHNEAFKFVLDGTENERVRD